MVNRTRVKGKTYGALPTLRAEEPSQSENFEPNSNPLPLPYERVSGGRAAGYSNKPPPLEYTAGTLRPLTYEKRKFPK